VNAHCLAFVLVPPAGGEHMHHHAEGGHTYFGSTPVLIAALVTVLAAGLVLCVAEGVRGTARLSPPAVLFALLPPLGFVVQEHLEDLIRSGSLSSALITEPTFLAGFALQLPFAVAALLLCRCLYTLGYGLGRLLARRVAVPTRVHGLAPPVHRRPARVTLIPPSVLALGHGSRAPPAPACP
jgi:hypothetical protein